MGVALLDSSVIVAFLDRDDALHRAADRAVREIASEHRFAASVVTLAEVLTGAKLGHHDEALVRRFFGQVVGRLVDVDEPIAQRAAEIRGEHRAVRMPDALILATADRGTQMLLTGDRRLREVTGLACAVRDLDAWA